MADQQSVFEFSSTKTIPFSPRNPENQAALRDRTNQRHSTISTVSRNTGPLLSISSLAVLDRSDNKHKLNWQYLYAQRRKLEANWEGEKYINFQLPHPNHPEEAHSECIYTIQHSGKYLVSGSRDQTLRIWNLDTRRLIRPPLRAHVGSVLCLQFDADPDEDLIVSGSSDATVILWKFSTGQMIQRLRRAHRESVLNVRFDKRILVTCSKDKTIKIFNRKSLHAGELGYPGIAQAVNPVPTYLNNYGFNLAPTAGLAVKPPYSMIGCLEGHGAAVNAVQIYGNEIVSASGDRTVKVWNWPEQTCTRTLIGHTKGIACVQYDGRRIVSGSSDNEVKVFDKESGLEVASLRAHTNLVRTVQAGFGDLPYSVEEDKEEARTVDYEYFKAIDTGMIPRTVYLNRGRPRNAGSRKPEDITAYGAKLPPGGGGGKFGRIVSGSYDETIIIWRRDKEGVWKAQHTLRQEDAAQAAARIAPDWRTSPPTTEHSSGSQLPSQSPALVSAAGATSSPPQEAQTPATVTEVDAPTAPFAPGTQAYYHHLIDLTVPQGPIALRQALQTHPQMIQYSHLQAAISVAPTSAQRAQLRSVVAAALSRQQLLLSQQLHLAGAADAAQADSQDISTGQSTQTTTPTLGVSTQTATPAPAPAVASTPTPVLNAQALATAAVAQTPVAAPHAHHAQMHPNLHPASMARVFKLQFDARRIICCSQTAVIVGWDFANEDEQIIEASKFFAPIE
jgi:F-box and WD-40 domain protein 1/11